VRVNKKSKKIFNNYNQKSSFILISFILKDFIDFFFFFFKIFVFFDSNLFRGTKFFLILFINKRKILLVLKDVEALDQVRCPLDGFPKAWALPLKDLIKYNLIKLYLIKSSIELFMLTNCEKYILIIFLKSKEIKLKFLPKCLLKAVNSNLFIK
jgi:hypothetical protein